MALPEFLSATKSMPEIITNPQDIGVLRGWREGFQKLFESAIAHYQSGRRGASQIFETEDVDFLASIGANPYEIYDYVEDYCEKSEPSFGAILAITAVRYDYYVKEQQRKSTGLIQAAETFPSGTKILAGFPWLPRIIAKARAKLKGELPPELMYSCETDRPFLKKVGIAPGDFLKIVWEARSNSQLIIARVEEAANLVKGSPF